MRRNIEKILGLAGMANCLFISITFTQIQVSDGESIWQRGLPPGLYLLEITVIGIGLSFLVALLQGGIILLPFLIGLDV